MASSNTSRAWRVKRIGCCTLIWRHRWRCVFCCSRVVRLGGSLPSSLMKRFRKAWSRKSARARTTPFVALLVDILTACFFQPICSPESTKSCHISKCPSCSAAGLQSDGRGDVHAVLSVYTRAFLGRMSSSVTVRPDIDQHVKCTCHACRCCVSFQRWTILSQLDKACKLQRPREGTIATMAGRPKEPDKTS